jgi:hypothetical protein
MPTLSGALRSGGAEHHPMTVGVELRDERTGIRVLARAARHDAGVAARPFAVKFAEGAIQVEEVAVAVGAPR